MATSAPRAALATAVAGGRETRNAGLRCSGERSRDPLLYVALLRVASWRAHLAERPADGELLIDVAR
eukprot:2316549-Alexandrium_andersonii.AAC.1